MSAVTTLEKATRWLDWPIMSIAWLFTVFDPQTSFQNAFIEIAQNFAIIEAVKGGTSSKYKGKLKT